MEKKFVPMIGFDEEPTLLMYIPFFILRKLSFELYAKKRRMLLTKWIKSLDLDTNDIKLRYKI